MHDNIATSIAPRAVANAAGRSAIHVLRLVFFFSGFASLMYQVVWQRLLTVYYGVGPVATTLIVSTYMLGLGLGALAGGAVAEWVKRRVLFYVMVETALGVFGAASPWLLDLLGQRTAGSSYPVSLVCMAAFLALPTVLMGITLPLLTKIVNALQRDFLKSLSFLYFVNTLGAAAGAVFASYVVISLWGLDSAAYLAAAINAALALVIFSYRNTDHVIAASDRPAAESAASSLGRLAYLCVFVTGFLAIGYEILWFRVLGVVLKDSPYAFSTILSVYLVGIALGSFAMVWYRQRRVSLEGRSTFFLLQVLIGVYLAVTFAGVYYLGRFNHWVQEGLQQSFFQTLHPPFWDTSYESFWPWLFQMTDVLLYPAIFVLVPTLFMGASFPLITTLALKRPDREGTAVGTIYFFNILGNVAGGVVTGYFFLHAFGAERTALGFSLAGLAMLLFVDRVFGWPLRLPYRAGAVVALGAAAVAAFPGRGDFYRMIHPGPPELMERHLAEGVDAVIVTDDGNGATHNYINGLNHGHRPGYWYLREAIEAFSYTPKCGNVLVIGFGAGTFVETTLLLDELRRLTVVEISPTLLENLRKMEVFEGMLSDPRVEVIVDDGRRFLLGTGRTYDMILVDPLRTTTSYSNNLYSREFFELVRRRLKPGGLFLAWMDEDRVFPKTLASVFPHVRMYELNPRPYFMGFCLASDQPLAPHEAREAELLAKIPSDMHPRIFAYGTFIGDQERIRAMTAGHPINRDWKPVLEYYFWRLRQREAWEKED
jgi:predicted membrane-bound spermidine synthase